MLPPGASAGAGAEEPRSRREGREKGRSGGKKEGAGVSPGFGVEEQGACLPKSGITRARTHTSLNLYSGAPAAAIAAICTLYPIPSRVRPLKYRDNIVVVSIFPHVVIISISSVWDEGRGKFWEVYLFPPPPLHPTPPVCFPCRRSPTSPSLPERKQAHTSRVCACLCHTSALLGDNVTPEQLGDALFLDSEAIT